MSGFHSVTVVLKSGCLYMYISPGYLLAIVQTRHFLHVCCWFIVHIYNKLMWFIFRFFSHLLVRLEMGQILC